MEFPKLQALIEETLSREEAVDQQEAGLNYAEYLRRKNKEPDWNQVKTWSKPFKAGFRRGWGVSDTRLS